MELVLTGTDTYKYADISQCGKYRYSLSRTWNSDLPGVLFIMLNPSTADAEDDDPTIRRCIGFAKAWSCGSIKVVNLFAYRTAYPSELAEVNESLRVGESNDREIRSALLTHQDAGDYIVVAWGASFHVAHIMERIKKVVSFLSLGDIMCLGITQNGSPKHPLYLPSNAILTKWEPNCF